MAFRLFKEITRDILRTDVPHGKFICESTQSKIRYLSTDVKTTKFRAITNTSTKSKPDDISFNNIISNENEQSNCLSIKRLQPNHLTPYCDKSIKLDFEETEEPKKGYKNIDVINNKAEEKYKVAEFNIKRETSKRYKVDNVRARQIFDVKKTHNEYYLTGVTRDLQPCMFKEFGEVVPMSAQFYTKPVDFLGNSYIETHKKTNRNDFTTRRNYSTHANIKTLKSQDVCDNNTQQTKSDKRDNGSLCTETTTLSNNTLTGLFTKESSKITSMNRAQKSTTRIKVGSKLNLLQSTLPPETYTFEEYVRTSDKYTVPWPSYSDTVKNRFIKKKTLINYPVNYKSNTQKLQERPELQKRNYSTLINKTEKIIQSASLVSTNLNKFLKQNVLLYDCYKPESASNILTRSFSSKSKHYGVLGPEYVIMPKLCRLPKVKIKEPEKVCEIKDTCELMPRSDSNLKISPKKLPTIPISNCPCVEQEDMKDIPLKRLKAKPVEQTRSYKDCKIEEICPPRADAGLKIESKSLPKYEPKPCICIEQSYVDVPLVRLKPKEIKEPKRICPKETICDIPRADENLQVVKKQLPILEPKSCPCVEETYKDVPLIRLKKVDIPEPKKVCPIEETCDDNMRADHGLKLKEKKLPKLPDNCSCVEPHVPTYLPPMKRLNLKVKEPKRYIPIICCEDAERADKNYKVRMKKLPKIPKSDCPCFEPPDMKSVPLKRLKAKPMTQNRMYQKCQIDEPCPPRADAGMKIEPKILPKYKAKPCPCVEEKYIDVPLVRLKRKEIKEPKRICPKETICDAPRADANLEIIKKQLPIIEPKSCPCVEETYKDVPLIRLKKVDIPEPKKVCPVKDDICDENMRADKDYKIKQKTLPTMILCEKNNEISIRQYQQSDVTKKKKFSTHSKYYHPTISSTKNFFSTSTTDIFMNNGIYLFKNIFSIAPNAKRCISASIVLHMKEACKPPESKCKQKKKEEPKEECKPKPCPQFGKKDTCPKFTVPGCKERARTTCKVNKILPDCNKQLSPYPSFSEVNEEVEDDRICHCPKDEYLQPKRPIIGEIETMEAPEPEVDVVDPQKEEECVYEKLNKQTCGSTKNCENFDRSHEPVRAKDHLQGIAAIVSEENADCKNVECKNVEVKNVEVENVECKNVESKKVECPTKEENAAIKPKICMEKPKKAKTCTKKKTTAKSTTQSTCGDKKPVRCPPPFPIECKSKTKKSLLQRICDYFKARPNCPTPDDYKKAELRKKAEAAAKKAGLVVCDPKLLEYEKEKKIKSSCTKSHPADKCAQFKAESKDDKKEPPKTGLRCPNDKPKKSDKCETKKGAEPERKSKSAEVVKPKCPTEKPKKVDKCETKKAAESEPKSKCAQIVKPECPTEKSKKSDKCDTKEPAKAEKQKPSASCATSKKKQSEKKNCKSSTKEDSPPPKDEKCKQLKMDSPAGGCTSLAKLGNPSKTRVQCIPEDCGRKQPDEEDETHEVSDYSIDKSKCKTFETDCPKRTQLTCKKIKTIPKCTIPEAPYPAFSDCKILFPKLRENECTKSKSIAKKRKISYPVASKSGDSKSYSTVAFRKYFSTMPLNNGYSFKTYSSLITSNHFLIRSNRNVLRVSRNISTAVLPIKFNAFQERILQKYSSVDHFLSNNIYDRNYSSKSSDKLSDLFDALTSHKPNQEIDNKKIALKILKAVEEGLKLLSKTNTLSIDNYSKIREELETLSLNYQSDNLYENGPYLIARDYLINLWPFMCNHPQQQANLRYDDDDNIMKICETISGFHENSIFNYEESERIKTENMQKVLDEILQEISRKDG